jgi:hypothetical protein
MKRAAALSLAALCSCAIDDRRVEVRATCTGPPPGGLISDFSTAHLGTCRETPCPLAFAGSTTVSLGTDGVRGLVVPHDRPDSVVLALGLTGDLGSVRDDASALRVVVSYDSLARPAPARVVAGFAIAFLSCLDASGYAAVRFRTDGDLGTCPLRFAVQFGGAGQQSSTGAAGCPLVECDAATSVAVTAGLTTAPLPSVTGGASATGADAAAGGTAISGLRWELGLPSDGSRRCSADFTIDDLELVAGP